MSRLNAQVYLWAIGASASQFSVNDRIQNRYKVIAPQIWQDLYPERLPFAPEQLPSGTIPYLTLFPYRLHLPIVYGVCQLEGKEVILLENAPIDAQGSLQPTLLESWSSASTLRQLYWLWQILELWTPLEKQGVAASLLIADNVHVEGWRIRLRELIQQSASVSELGKSWSDLVRITPNPLANVLADLTAQFSAEIPFSEIKSQLNALLLEQAAQQPLRRKLISATDVGVQPSHNEDSYYPTSDDLNLNGASPYDPLSEHLMIVCDGIGGHEGGEVASQLAVQTLKLQVRALLSEIQVDSAIMSPDLVAEQLCAIIRVANNLIAARNREQGRESRRRMGTTLVMALQLPQKVQITPSEIRNSHELYIAHVGDSRAYWINSSGCYLLSVDDDVASREVRFARNLYREALQRADAVGLTQALGTKEAEALRPTVQRFILEEDGILLLCSDGLSDNHLIEEIWESFAPQVIAGTMSLEAAVEFLMVEAKERNGHDNISFVLVSYGVSLQQPVLVNLSEKPDFSGVGELTITPPEPAYALVPLPVSEEIPSPDVEEEVNTQKVRIPLGKIFLAVLAVILIGVTAGLVARQWVMPSLEQLPSPEIEGTPQGSKPNLRQSYAKIVKLPKNAV